MNSRTPRPRGVPFKPNWIGPILWFLAAALLVLTIAILVMTVPRKNKPRSSMGAASLTSWCRFAITSEVKMHTS